MVARVVVCYTGGVGSQVIRLLAGDPAFQVAGVLVHHQEKEGRDAGDLVGIDPIGVAATRDIDALVALRSDCMLWHGLTWEPQVVARFLAAGTNVYSGMGGWYLPGEPEHEMLAEACEKGGSTFAAGGNIPGLISDVLPLFISGYSSRVRFIRAWQSSYVPHYPSALQLQFGLGIGVEPDLTATEPSEVDKAWLWGIRQSAHMVGAGLGVPVTDVRLTNKEYAATPEDMELVPSGLKVARGHPGRGALDLHRLHRRRAVLRARQRADGQARARRGLAGLRRRAELAARGHRRAEHPRHGGPSRRRRGRRPGLGTQRRPSRQLRAAPGRRPGRLPERARRGGANCHHATVRYLAVIVSDKTARSGSCGQREVPAGTAAGRLGDGLRTIGRFPPAWPAGETKT